MESLKTEGFHRVPGVPLGPPGPASSRGAAHAPRDVLLGHTTPPPSGGAAAAPSSSPNGFRTPPPCLPASSREESPFSHQLFLGTPHHHYRSDSMHNAALLSGGGGAAGVGGGGALAAAKHTPPAKDRFISHRDDSLDGSGGGIAHFLLTTEDPMTPMLLSHVPAAAAVAAGGGGGGVAAHETPHRLAGGVTPRHGGSAASGSRFGVSPSPARSLFGAGSEPRMAASGSLPRTALNSLFNSPNRFESEVGTDAGLDEDGEEDLLFGGTFGAAGSSIGSNASRFIGTGGLLEHSSSRLHHGGGGSAHHNMIGSPSQSQNGANMLVNVEPYNARLARSLFSDVTQTSVLRHHSTNGAIDANASHDDASLTNRDGEPDVSYQDRLAVAKSMSSALRRSPVPTASGVSPLLQRRQSSMMMLDGGDHPEEEEEGPAGAGAGAEGLLRRISSQAAASRSPSRSLGATTMRIGQNTPQSQRGHCGFGGGSLSRNENRFDGSRTSVADYSLAGRGQSLFMDDDDDDDNNNEEEGGQNAGVAQSSFRVLSGSATATASHLGGGGNDAARFDQSPAVVFEQNKAKNFMSRGFRHISSTPDRILDAARLVDEFYYNVLDCSCHNVVAVALEAALYLWDWSTENISTLPPENSFISGVKWAPDGIRLASSNEEGDVVVWDTETSKDDAVFTVHKERVCALAWNATGNILASGSKDASIVLNDTRSRTPALTLPKGVGHTKEVCGLQWSLRDLYLASGGDDNKLLVWDSRRLDTPLHTLTQHSSAVKALSWHPIQPHLLVSGGGIEDKMLRFWSADTGECVRQAHTSSQVCGVAWHHSGTELVSCHGFPHHQITLWKYPSLNRVVDLCGHRSRVLHLCLSAGGETVISAASDETVRFWSCFPPGPEAQQNGDEDEEG